MHSLLTDNGNGLVQDDGFKWEDVVPSYLHSTRTQDCDDFEAALREAEQRSRGEAVTSCEAAVWERMRYANLAHNAPPPVDMFNQHLSHNTVKKRSTTLTKSPY